MHLTLRLSRDLARAVSRWAKVHGVPKSQVVREAVASHVGASTAAPAAVEHGPVTGRVAAARWPSLPHLTPDEAGGLAGGIAASRTSLLPVGPPWE